MTAYKLLRQMKSGALRSLFIDKSADRPLNTWLQAKFHPTKGYSEQHGWHCTYYPVAPHLTSNGRVWVEVELDGDIEIRKRPECQGGKWLLGKGRMRIIRILSNADVANLSMQAQEDIL